MSLQERNMTIEIYNENNEYVKTVVGDLVQCLSNVSENETYIEVEEVRNVQLYNYDDYFKTIKAANISNIIVTTTSGKMFDGDEKSQERMLRAINIASITGQATTQWKLADNSIVEVTLDELKEALSLAGQEMSRIWLN